MTRSWRCGALLLIAAGGLALRLPHLDLRPMHGDEAVHAVKFDTLWRTGRYVYDPNEYHGPLLYYATLPAVWLSGARTFADTTETTYRLVPVIFGVGLILLLLLVADGLGWRAALAAGVLTALSPALVFYSRYYIQETLLAFFAFAVVATGWRYLRSRRVGWALLAGAAAGAMHATKETCLIGFGCMAAALAGACWCARHLRTGESPAKPRPQPSSLTIGIVAAAAVAVLVSVAFYSAFGTNPRGVWDSVRTYGTYFERAGGAGLHDHPWPYYLRMLAFTHLAPGPWWSEGLILLLGVIGCAAALSGRWLGEADRRFARFLALYALLMTATYSAIPYKTPWCLLQFLQPLILMAGIGVTALFQWATRPRPREALAVLLAGAAVHLGWQAHRASFRFCVDYRNPYVYAHPLRGVVRLANWIERLARVHPDGHRLLIKVIAEDPWPLPWYLRRFERVGYWEEPPADPDAPVVVVSERLEPRLPARFRDPAAYQVNVYGLRPDVRLFACIDRALYEAFAAHETEAGAHAP